MSTTAAHANLDRLDAIGYDGHFTVHTEDFSDLHPRTADQVATLLGLATNWAYMLTHDDGGVVVDGGDMTCHRSRWTIHVPAGLVDGLPDGLLATIRDAQTSQSASTPETAP